MDFLGSLLRIFGEFFGNFLEDFFGGIFGSNFWEDFLGGIFFWGLLLGGIFWEDFFLFTLLKSAKVFEYKWNLCFCQDFGVRKGRKEVEFSILRSAIASTSHLKIA